MNYHPCTYILIEGLKKLKGGQKVLDEWDHARKIVDNTSQLISCTRPDLIKSNIKIESK